MTIQESSVINIFRNIIYSFLLGILLGVLGELLMGYLAAVAIPREFILWFENTTLALAAISFVSQFFIFGTIATAIGVALGQLSGKWLLNSLACYFGFLFYSSVGIAFVYGGEISPLYSGIYYYDVPSILLLPTFLFLSTCITAKKS
jgi:hypothetical protein